MILQPCFERVQYFWHQLPHGSHTVEFKSTGMVGMYPPSQPRKDSAGFAPGMSDVGGTVCTGCYGAPC